MQLNGVKMISFSNKLKKLKFGISRTKDKIVKQISESISGKAIIDEDVLEEVEEILISSDVNYKIVEKIIDAARIKIKETKQRSKIDLLEIIKEEFESILSNYKVESEIEKFNNYKPYVILIVGVNGVGKTTTIAKLANIYKNKGFKVLIGSGDTFRAAANEQLEIWGKRIGIKIVNKQKGSDPSAVAFDTLTIARKENADVVLIDTAGRLHTKQNLMQELGKIKRVLNKVLDYAPNDVFLVVDGNTGQNALMQAKEFSKFTDLTGLIVTKLDGTAKGGMVFSICSELNIPIKYIGVGEGIDDLLEFEPQNFVEALFE